MTIKEQIRRAEVTINAVLEHPTLQKKLDTFGYKKAKIMEGKALYEKVILLNASQQKEYGESYGATDALHVAQEEAKQIYMHHLSTARFALSNDRSQWKALQLGGKRKRALFDWLEQARTFYANIGSVINIMTRYNVTKAELEQGKAMIEAVFAAHQHQRKEYNEALQSTQKRDAALEALNAWMSKFIRVAGIAFDEEPKALQTLGLMAKA